ncbi:hypothetical protein Tco_0014232 [Tanacetum coccineum]
MFQNLLKIGMLVWGEADSETSTKRSLRRKLFKTCCMNWGEVNPTHAYYNGSCTSKDTEDPSWSTSFKTRRTQKTSSALEDFICVVFVPDRNIVYTLPMTYPEEVEETIGILMEVEPLDYTKLVDLGLNTCSHALFLSSRRVPSVDESEPQPLPNFPSLELNLGDKKGTDSPINPYSLGSFRMR